MNFQNSSECLFATMLKLNKFQVIFKFNIKNEVMDIKDEFQKNTKKIDVLYFNSQPDDL